MLRDRNTMAHLYDAGAAQRLVHDVLECYVPEFVRVQQGLETRYGDLLRS